jgi:hypothetical protein
MKEPKTFQKYEPVAVIIRNKTFTGCYVSKMEGELCHEVSFPSINHATGLLRLGSFYFRDNEVFRVISLTIEKNGNGKNGNGKKNGKKI